MNEKGELIYKWQKSFNLNYFSSIDTPEKAYWLGFIGADGNIFGRALQIAITDENHLEKLKLAISSEHKIQTYITDSGSRAYRFAIVNQRLVDQLLRLGIGPFKSLTYSFPTKDILPKEFINSFMLGYFDGDGSIQEYKPEIGGKKWNFGIIGTKEFCQEFQDIICHECDLFPGKIIKYKRIPDKNIWETKTCGVYGDRLARIYKFLYSNCADIALERKKEKFSRLINECPAETYHSKFYGVVRSGNRWSARKKTKGIVTAKHGFKTEIEAARHFDILLKNANGDLRYLNFPND